jgi:sulfonate transport system substrate-binding protein
MTMAMRMRTLAAAGAAALLLAATFAASGQDAKPGVSRVRLAVGGKPALFYLPLTVTERLGYFRDAGLDVEISDFPGGARALQALIGGSADVVTGSFDHTIQMQAKGQPIVAVVQLGQFPGYVLGVLTAKAQTYRSPVDLKGMKIGVTAPGSSTHFMAQHLLVKHGLKRDDASFVGIGASASAVAAVQRGEIDAIVNVDPVINLLESQGLIKVVADTRTLEGTREVFGGAYPAAVRLGRTSRRGRRHDACRAHAGAGRLALDRARAHRRAAAPRLRDYQGARGEDRRLVLAEPGHRLPHPHLSRGSRLCHRGSGGRQEALHHH